MSGETPMLANAYDAARRICQDHARSFYFASHFLPREKRSHAYAVYAFCRLLDDAVDEASDQEARETALVRFSTLLDTIYAGQAAVLAGAPASADEDLAMAAFAHTVRVCGIPRGLFDDLAQGCRMDLTITTYATWADLEKYCYHVAGVVGVIMCYVFGVSEPWALQHAIEMGNAMQLTNILRDIAEDKARGRVYLPQDELAKFGHSSDTLSADHFDERFKDFMKFQVARAWDLYMRGSLGLVAIDDLASRRTAAIMAVVYGGILKQIKKMDYNVFKGRARLSTVGKMLRLRGAMRLARRRADEPLPEVF